jgi:hypothetical protein
MGATSISKVCKLFYFGPSLSAIISAILENTGKNTEKT